MIHAGINGIRKCYVDMKAKLRLLDRLQNLGIPVSVLLVS